MIDKAFEAILSQGGVWAALFLLAVGWAIYLHGQLRDCWTARLGETKALGEIIHANSVVMTAQTAAFDARTRVGEATARAQELSALELASVRQEVQRLGVVNESLKSDLQRELQRLGDDLRGEVARRRNGSNG